MENEAKKLRNLARRNNKEYKETINLCIKAAEKGELVAEVQKQPSGTVLMLLKEDGIRYSNGVLRFYV